jgi:hypothetical protein
MKYTRIYTGNDGKSRFGDVELPVKDYRPAYSKDVVGHQTETTKSTGIFFREWIPGLEQDWHTAPRRQFVIVTEGELEIVTGDGMTRRFGPGEFFLVDDFTGQGHMTKIVRGKTTKTIFVPLE